MLSLAYDTHYHPSHLSGTRNLAIRKEGRRECGHRVPEWHLCLQQAPSSRRLGQFLHEWTEAVWHGLGQRGVDVCEGWKFAEGVVYG
jgi:hypothetical protein